MQLKNVVLALVGMSAVVEGSALRGRFHGVHGSAMLETRQNRGGQNNNANANKGGAAAAANGPNPAPPKPRRKQIGLGELTPLIHR